MVQAKKIYILKIKVNKLFLFYWTGHFLKGIENMFSLFRSNYKDTHESLENLKKLLWRHSPTARVPTAFFVLPNFHSCLYNLNMAHVFYFLNNAYPASNIRPLCT